MNTPLDHSMMDLKTSFLYNPMVFRVGRNTKRANRIDLNCGIVHSEGSPRSQQNRDLSSNNIMIMFDHA